jgi:hypothetical protein
MELYNFFNTRRQSILSEACSSLAKSHLHSYDKVKADANRERLTNLYDVVRKSAVTKNIAVVKEYSTKIARERYEAGYDLHEVHSAFNVLEEAIWKEAMKHIPAEQIGETLAMVSTVLGAGKETLALTYVGLVSRTKVRNLDLTELLL